MMLLLRWALTAGAFWVVAHFVPGISIANWKTAVLLALLWGLLAFTMKPILLLLTLPINLLSLGLFTFIINGFLLWLLGGVVKGFEVHGFWMAVVGGLILSALMTIIDWLIDRDDE